jgi:hypothetical protein
LKFTSEFFIWSVPPSHLAISCFFRLLLQLFWGTPLNPLILSLIKGIQPWNGGTDHQNFALPKPNFSISLRSKFTQGLVSLPPMLNGRQTISNKRLTALQGHDEKGKVLHHSNAAKRRERVCHMEVTVCPSYEAVIWASSTWSLPKNLNCDSSSHHTLSCYRAIESGGVLGQLIKLTSASATTLGSTMDQLYHPNKHVEALQDARLSRSRFSRTLKQVLDHSSSSINSDKSRAAFSILVIPNFKRHQSMWYYKAFLLHAPNLDVLPSFRK